MELGGYFAILRRWWWTVLMAAWIAGLVGFVFATGMTPTYEARARLLVGPVSADINTLRAAAGLIPTFAEFAESEPVLARVIDELQLDTSTSALSERITVTANDTTRVLTIRFDDSDPDRVAAVPNEIANQLVELQPGGSVLSEGEVSVIEPATPPLEPAAPDVPLLVVLAAGAGFVGAIILVMLLEYSNRSIRDPAEVERLVDVPLIATVRPPSPRAHRHQNSPLFVEAFPTSQASTALRTGTIKAVYRQAATPVRSLLVVAVDDGLGSGVMAANMAAVISQSGQRVTLVDANDAAGEATALMTAIDLPGVAELLSTPAEEMDQSTIEEHRLPRWGGVDVIPRGHGEIRVVHPTAVAQLLDRLQTDSDLTIVTASPVQHSGTALVWGRTCDATVLCARRDRTKREALMDAIESLRLVGANPVGVILLERPSAPGFGADRRETFDKPAAGETGIGADAQSRGADAASVGDSLARNQAAPSSERTESSASRFSDSTR